MLLLGPDSGRIMSGLVSVGEGMRRATGGRSMLRAIERMGVESGSAYRLFEDDEAQSGYSSIDPRVQV